MGIPNGCIREKEGSIEDKWRCLGWNPNLGFNCFIRQVLGCLVLPPFRARHPWEEDPCLPPLSLGFFDPSSFYDQQDQLGEAEWEGEEGA